MRMRASGHEGQKVKFSSTKKCKMSTTDDWLYSDDLDVNISMRDRLDSSDSRVLDGDLLDDVLTAPATAPASSRTPTNEDELLGIGVVQEEETLEGSASARLNAEVMARTVQSRIESSKTSQSIQGGGVGSTIYSREPNRKNSFFIGNLTWWTTDMDLINAVHEVGLGEVVCFKFYENRANGQSKGYALIELANDSLAVSAQDKLQTLTIHNQTPLVMYAAKMSPHQFETKCNAAKSGGSVSHSSSSTSMSSNSSTSLKTKSQTIPMGGNLPVAPPIRPPTAGLPGFPLPPMPGFRPPGLPGDLTGGLGLMGPPPPIPPPGLPNLPPGIIPGLGNPLIRPSLPGMPNLPPGMLGDQLKNAGVAPHLNPAFLQEMAAQGGMAGGQKAGLQNMAELFARFRSQAAAAALGGAGGGASAASNGAKHPTEEEAADANQRNRAISSSAISRAMSDANSGDYDGAIDTLKMAITLIKQSVTSGTEASQILIQSLQDCLHSIEDQSTVTKRSSSSRREHRSHDDRDRSRSSSHRSSKHHRDRSRERRR